MGKGQKVFQDKTTEFKSSSVNKTAFLETAVMSFLKGIMQYLRHGSSPRCQSVFAVPIQEAEMGKKMLKFLACGFSFGARGLLLEVCQPATATSAWVENMTVFGCIFFCLHAWGNLNE